MNKGMYERPVVDVLRDRGDEQAKHSMGFRALEILDREVGAIATQTRRPLRILEIGRYRGYSTVVLAQHGRVWSLDICNQRDTQDVIDASPHKDRIVCLTGYDQPAVRSLVVNLAPFDVVYVDGDHSGEGGRIDCAFVRGMAPVYFFHDYQDKYPGLQSAIDSFVEEVGGTFNLWGNTSGLCRVITWR